MKLNCGCTKSLCSLTINVLATNCIWGFLTSVERAIIFPTLWLYLVSRFGEDIAVTYYGITLAAFNVSSFIIMPISGWIVRSKIASTKVMLIISNIFEIFGNLMYLVGKHPWVLLIGRLVSGFGAGAEVNLMSDWIRVTPNEKRTTYFSYIMVVRQVGLIAGPAVSLVHQNLKWKLGDVDINVYNSPGLIMLVLWILQTVQVIIFYPLHLSNETEEQPLIDDEHNLVAKDTKETDESEVSKDEKEDDNEKKAEEHKISDGIGLSEFCDRNLRGPVMTLVLIIFIGYTCLIAAESIIPAMMINNLGWTTLHTSGLYLGCGITVVLVFIAMQPAFRIIIDKKLIITGVIILISSYTWLSVQSGTIKLMPPAATITLLMIGLFFHIIGLVLLTTCADSLYSKLVSHPDDTDMGQSLMRSVTCLSYLVGPAGAGLLVYYPYIVFILMTFLCIIPLILLWKYYSQLQV